MPHLQIILPIYFTSFRNYVPILTLPAIPFKVAIAESEASVEVLAGNEPTNKVLAESESLEVSLPENELTEETLIESKSSEEVSAESRPSNIVLVLGILARLFLFWSFLWWTIIRDGNPNIIVDLDILIVFCSPGLILGIFAIVLGNKDLVKMKVGESSRGGLRRNIIGILLGAYSVGMTASLIIIRWIILSKT